RRDVAGGRHVEVHPQEEPSRFGIAELLRVEDVAAVLEQQPRHAVDDAGAVGAGQGQDVVAGHRTIGNAGQRATMSHAFAPDEPRFPLQPPPARSPCRAATGPHVAACRKAGQAQRIATAMTGYRWAVTAAATCAGDWNPGSRTTSTPVRNSESVGVWRRPRLRKKS